MIHRHSQYLFLSYLWVLKHHVMVAPQNHKNLFILSFVGTSLHYLFLGVINCQILILSPHSDGCELSSQKAEIPFQPFGLFEKYKVNLVNE